MCSCLRFGRASAPSLPGGKSHPSRHTASRAESHDFVAVLFSPFPIAMRGVTRHAYAAFMSDEPSMSTEGALNDAIGGLASTDAHLEGSRATKWIVVVESEWDDGSTLSVFRSEDQRPWDSLGMLRFAILQEERRAGDDVDSL